MQFEEEVILDFELAPRECSYPQHQDDASDDSLYDISGIFYSEMAEDDVSEHDSPTRPKWVEKTLEAAGNLASNPLDPRKSRSQFHTTSFASEVYLAEKFFMMVVSNPKSYKEASIDPIWQTSIQEKFNSLRENKTWE